jgi:polar amino acid transport system substrate-binding protein
LRRKPRRETVKEAIVKRIATVIVILAIAAGGGLWAQNTLTASLAEIPGLADSPEEGVLVEIVKAIDEVWEEGTIDIIVAPFARSIQNVIRGDADFHIPGFVANFPDLSSPSPLARCPVPLGEVEIVIYSRADNPISREDIDAAMARGGEFPYVIEAGIQEMFAFPTASSSSTEQSLRKVQAGRIDGYLWPPEADVIVRELQLDRIHREFLDLYADPVLVANTERGAEVSEILAAALTVLQDQGRLELLHAPMHMLYTVWQPHEDL